MGYGIVYLGSLRNDVGRVREILDLPEYAFLYSVWLGEPAEDENGSPKPRLPFEHVFHKMSIIVIKHNKRNIKRL